MIQTPRTLLLLMFTIGLLGCFPSLRPNSSLMANKLESSIDGLSISYSKKFHYSGVGYSRRSPDYRGSFPSYLSYLKIRFLLVSNLKLDSHSDSAILRLIFLKNDTVRSVFFEKDSLKLFDSSGRRLPTLNYVSIDGMDGDKVVLDAHGSLPFGSDIYGSYVDIEFTSVRGSKHPYKLVIRDVVINDSSQGNIELVFEEGNFYDVSFHGIN